MTKEKETTEAGRPCPRDCGKCNPWQQVFCCAKMLFEASGAIQQLRVDVENLREDIGAIRTNMPMSTDVLSNPMIDTEHNKASGAI